MLESIIPPPGCANDASEIPPSFARFFVSELQKERSDALCQSFERLSRTLIKMSRFNQFASAIIKQKNDMRIRKFFSNWKERSIAARQRREWVESQGWIFAQFALLRFVAGCAITGLCLFQNLGLLMLR
jgi:hypothetical protein